MEALEDALEKPNTFLLTGHDYNRTLADMRTGTPAVTLTREAVELEAALPPEDEATFRGGGRGSGGSRVGSFGG